MPNYKPEIKKARAKILAKDCIKSRLNQSTVARKLGVSHQAINQRIHRAPVQKTLQEMINRNLKRAGISATKVYKRQYEQLDGTRIISAVVSPDGKDKDANGQTCDFIEVPDNNARDKAIERCLTLMGHLKQHNGKNETHLHLTIEHKEKIRERLQSRLGCPVSFKG
jgi:hypothetical protein